MTGGVRQRAPPRASDYWYGIRFLPILIIIVIMDSSPNSRSQPLSLLLISLILTSISCPTLALAQLPWKSPHGIFEMGSNANTNPTADGRRMQILWSDIQPNSAAEFNWSSVDAQLANAQQNQKQFGLSVVILSAAPPWLASTPGVTTYQLPPKNGKTTSIVLPWDPVVQEKIVNFVTQLCQRYDGVVDYIVMGGLGFNTESYMPDPADIGLNMSVSEAATAWIASSNAIIDAHATHLYSTPCIMAAGLPFTGHDGQDALSEVVDRATALYGSRFGIMAWTLSATSSTVSLVNSLISQYSPTHPAGYQFLCPAAGNDNGKTLGGTFQQALDAGIALGAHWFEVYSEDASNSAYAGPLGAAAAAMAPPPPPPGAPPPTPTPKPGASATPSPGPTVPASPPPVYLLNVSTRVQVQNDDQVLIGGFIISGDAKKSVVIRALGPSLANLGVHGALLDPVLELHNAKGELIAQNDNYSTPLPNSVVESGLTPLAPAESLISVTLPAGIYTAVLRGANGATGIALCELYDTDPTRSRVANISTRGLVGSGDQAMIGGFIVGGAGSSNVLVRALGPSLSSSGVLGPLADPVLELRDSEGSLIFSNDNWRSDQAPQIIGSSLAPANDKEPALIATLPPGAYTAVVRGAKNGSGVALVEVYSLAPE